MRGHSARDCSCVGVNDLPLTAFFCTLSHRFIRECYASCGSLFLLPSHPFQNRLSARVTPSLSQDTFHSPSPRANTSITVKTCPLACRTGIKKNTCLRPVTLDKPCFIHGCSNICQVLIEMFYFNNLSRVL